MGKVEANDLWQRMQIIVLLVIAAI